MFQGGRRCDDWDMLGLICVTTMVGAALLLALTVRFYPFIHAFMTFSISTKPAELFLPLAPVGQGRIDAQLYRFLLTILVCVLGLSIASIQRRRSRQSVRNGGSALAIVVTMFVVSLVMLQVPYRTVWKNESARVDVAGERCYVIGEDQQDRLIHCPDRPVPRNRVVKRSDPEIHTTGLIENIFTPRDTSH